MTRSWESIRETYASRPTERAAVMLSLVEKIQASRYAEGLFAWTSHNDLCIMQMPATYPRGFGVPFLLIRPDANASHLLFRYEDTMDEKKRWARTVEAERGFDRLERFLDELHWFVKYA